MSTTTVDLSDEQKEIKDVARRFLDNEYSVAKVRELQATEHGFTDESWAEIAEMGWAGIAVAEEQGGAGFGDPERVVLMEEMGRNLLTAPYLSTAVLAADVLEGLAAAGSPEAGELLAAIMSGETRATVVASGDLLAGPSLAGGVTASGSDGSFSLSGSGGLVIDGGSAQTLVVVAESDGGVGVFSVDADADGVTREPVALVEDSRKAARIDFDGAAAQRIDTGEDATDVLRRAFDRSTVALAAELVGVASQALDITLEYLRDRKQFGVAIGSFQALKHRASDMGVGIDAARETVLLAVDALSLDDDEGVAAAVSAAKAAASDFAVFVGAECIQLYGGIGFTQEGDVNLYYKRALVGAAILGSATDHRDRIARSFGL